MSERKPGLLAVVIDHDAEKEHTEVAAMHHGRTQRLIFTDNGSSRTVGDLVRLLVHSRSGKLYVAGVEWRAEQRSCLFRRCGYFVGPPKFYDWREIGSGGDMPYAIIRVDGQEVRRVLWVDLTLGILERALEQPGMGTPDCTPYLDDKTGQLATALEAGMIEVELTLQPATTDGCSISSPLTEVASSNDDDDEDESSTSVPSCGGSAGGWQHVPGQGLQPFSAIDSERRRLTQEQREMLVEQIKARNREAISVADNLQPFSATPEKVRQDMREVELREAIALHKRIMGHDAPLPAPLVARLAEFSLPPGSVIHSVEPHNPGLPMPAVCGAMMQQYGESKLKDLDEAIKFGELCQKYDEQIFQSLGMPKALLEGDHGTSKAQAEVAMFEFQNGIFVAKRKP